MSDPDKSSGPNDAVQSAVSEFRDAWLSGRHLDPDEFCEKHPECGPELRREIDDFLSVAKSLPKGGREPEINLLEKAAEGHAHDIQVIGDFRIVREIGKGGMGTVYEAEQISMRRKVALKVLSAHLSFSVEAVQRFRREAEAGGRQTHPGIVTIHAVGEHKGVHYIAQELVEGGYSLSDKLDELKKTADQPPGYFREVAQLVAEVADALEHAHQSGVIHRDIKPSNILLNPEGRPKVTDFGLAKVEDALALSHTGDFAGTPFYMSPEQAMSRRIGIDKRTDIYSLGVSLYEMLTLKRPFEGETPQEVLKKIILHDPESPHRANPRSPRDLSTICLKAMEKPPEKRYQSMREFADDLRRFLSGDVVLAKPAGLRTLAWKRMKRNPVVSVVVGLTALFAVAFMGYLLLWSYPKIKAERDRAREAKEQAVAAKNNALKEREQKEGLRLAALSSLVLADNPGRALLLSIEAAKRSPGVVANTALLNALNHCHERKYLKIADIVWKASLTPDATKVVATGPNAGTTRIVDLSTGEILFTLDQDTGFYRYGTLSPDGNTVAITSENQVQIRNITDGRLLLTLEGHKNEVLSAAFSPDGGRLVTASRDKTARIWNVQDGRVLTTLGDRQLSPIEKFLKGSIFRVLPRGKHDDWVVYAGFSPDGKKVVTASDDGAARIWDVATGDEVRRFEHEGTVRMACFSPDGMRLVTASADRTARVWSIENGNAQVILTGHEDTVNSACFSPDGRMIVTASSDWTARVWDALTGSEILVLKGHDRPVKCAVFSSDNERVTTVSEDGSVRCWDLIISDEIVSIGGEADRITSAQFSPDAQRVVTCSERGIASICDALTGKKLLNIEDEFHVFQTASFDPHGKSIMTVSKSGVATIWDAETGQEITRFGGRDFLIRQADFSPGGRQVLTLGTSITGGLLVQIYDESKARIWDLYGNLPKFVILDHGEHDNDRPDDSATRVRINSAEFARDGRSVLTAASDGTARLWDVPSGNELLRIRPENADHRMRASLSPDCQYVVTYCAYDVYARTWNALTGNNITTFGRYSNFASLHFDPNSLRMVTLLNVYGEEDVAWIFDAGTGNPLMKLTGHEDTIKTATFSPDGNEVLTVSEDSSVRIWNSLSGDEVVRLRDGNRGIESSVFSPDGRRILTVFTDGLARIWPLDVYAAANRIKTRNLTLSERAKYAIDSESEHK